MQFNGLARKLTIRQSNPQEQVKERIRILEWFKLVKVKGESLVIQVVKTPPAM